MKPSDFGEELALTLSAKAIMSIKGQDKNYRKYWYAKFQTQININNLYDVEKCRAHSPSKRSLGGVSEANY